MIFISIMLLIILFCLALATPSRATQKHSPLRPQSSALQALIKPGKLNIVLFSDSKCQHCSPCVNAFGVLAEVNTAANLHLVHTQLNESNRHIFQQLKLSMLPTILAFNHSERLEHEFECLGSSNKLYRQMSKWLTRLERSIQHWNQEENHAHQIIVDCSEHTKLFWENVEQKELWLDLYCGNSTFLGDNLAVVAEYGKVIEAWRLENKNTESLQQKLSFLIKAYKYKFVVNWNVAIAQQIFAGNQSAFVLLTNNETASRQVYTLYEQIKRNWYERRQQHPVPILFAVTDLAQNTYQTVRLKRYLTGLATTSKKEYFYPLLAFIQAGQYPQKYVMPFHLHKDKETVQNWVYSVYNGTVLNLNNTEPLVQPYLNGDTDHITPSQADEEHQDPDKPYHYIKTQQEWRDLLSDNFTSPFFVYVSWRNSYELQKLEHQVIEWWKEKEGNSTAKKVIRINLLQNVDLPAELRVGYVPSLIFVGSSKQVRKLQGVTDLRKVQQFVAQLQAK